MVKYSSLFIADALRKSHVMASTYTRNVQSVNFRICLFEYIDCKLLIDLFVLLISQAIGCWNISTRYIIKNNFEIINLYKLIWIAFYYVALKMPDMKSLKKIILLKLADEVSFDLNISLTVKKQTLQSCISFRSNRRKFCLCYLLFYLVWWHSF